MRTLLGRAPRLAIVLMVVGGVMGLLVRDYRRLRCLRLVLLLLVVLVLVLSNHLNFRRPHGYPDP